MAEAAEPDKKRVKREASVLQRELEEYFATAGQKPPATDLRAFLESPLSSNPNSPCLQGTIDNESNTALMAAVKAGADEAFYILLEGKDQGYVNFQNSKGVTALNIASHRGYVDYVKALIEKAKADVNIPNSSGSTSLIQASHFGHTEVVELLLSHGAMVDNPNHKGTTALMRAAQEGHLGVVKVLLRAGADVNKRNHEHMNALMLASQRGHAAIVKLLIKHGADIDCQTVQGSTALMLACKRQHEAVVEVLIVSGAEIFMQDSRGKTARDTAQKRNNKRIIEMLHSHSQVRLMQMEVRTHRSHLMAKLYELHSKKRAYPVASMSSWPLDNSMQMLHRIFDLPFSLFQCVVKYMPWPRIWESVLPMLHKRCNIDPNEAIRGALSVMDEVFTDLLVSSDPVQEMHLVRAAHEPAIGELLRVRYKMPSDILETIVRWNDVQSVLSRFERQVYFHQQVADRAVKDAARLYSWMKFGDGVNAVQASSGETEGAIRREESNDNVDMDDSDPDDGPDFHQAPGNAAGNAAVVIHLPLPAAPLPFQMPVVPPGPVHANIPVAHVWHAANMFQNGGNVVHNPAGQEHGGDFEEAHSDNDDAE